MEIKVIAKTDEKYPLAPLWDTVVGGVQQAGDNTIV